MVTLLEVRHQPLRISLHNNVCRWRLSSPSWLTSMGAVASALVACDALSSRPCWPPPLFGNNDVAVVDDQRPARWYFLLQAKEKPKPAGGPFPSHCKCWVKKYDTAGWIGKVYYVVGCYYSLCRVNWHVRFYRCTFSVHALILFPTVVVWSGHAL